MTKLEEIEQEIKKLEGMSCITYDICHKLADLYVVRDHLREPVPRPMTPQAAPAIIK